MNYVLLWSKSENSLHVESMEQMLSKNREAYRDEVPCDFLPIAIGDQFTLELAAASVGQTIAARQAARKEFQCPT